MQPEEVLVKILNGRTITRARATTLTFGDLIATSTCIQKTLFFTPSGKTEKYLVHREKTVFIELRRNYSLAAAVHSASLLRTLY